MKLEYLPAGSQDCPLVRLYDFDTGEAVQLRDVACRFSKWSVDIVAVHDLPFVEPVDSCRLTLCVSKRNHGLSLLVAPSNLVCALSQCAWDNITGLIDPFCEAQAEHGFQWLDKSGDISLLLSPSGDW